jgi:hypothetical protein
MGRATPHAQGQDQGSYGNARPHKAKTVAARPAQPRHRLQGREQGRALAERQPLL